MKADRYVGLDVHKATTTVMLLDASGHLAQQTTLPTQTAALRDFFAGFRGPGPGRFRGGRPGRLAL